jgi:hypothetical protein
MNARRSGTGCASKPMIAVALDDVDFAAGARERARVSPSVFASGSE